MRAPNARIVQAGAFSRREAMNYLHAKLHVDPDQWVGALDLATELGFLPIAVAQAGALMAATGIDCREYRLRMVEQRGHLRTPAGIISSTVAATGALAIDLANRLPPAGLAWPALALSSMLDPHGIPGAVFTSQAACAFLTRFGGGGPVDDVRPAPRCTTCPGGPGHHRHHQRRPHRLGSHAGQALTRQALSAYEGEQAARAAADAVLQVWPGRGAPRSTRPCATAPGLRQLTGALLWSPQCHRSCCGYEAWPVLGWPPGHRLLAGDDRHQSVGAGPPTSAHDPRR